MAKIQINLIKNKKISRKLDNLRLKKSNKNLNLIIETNKISIK